MLETGPLTLASGERACSLQVASDPSALPSARPALASALPALASVRIRPSAAAALASTHVQTFTAEVSTAKDARESFTFDIPNKGAAVLAHLDEHGVAKSGSVVVPGTILIGRVQDKASTLLSQEEKLLRAIFGEMAGDVRDASVACPPDAKGTVTRAVREVGEKSIRVEVDVTDHRALAVGDVLTLGGERAVVSEISEDLPAGAAMVWSGPAGTFEVQKIQCAEAVLHARGIGPYSIVTQQPLGGKAQFGGQLFTGAHAALLESAGAWQTLHELLTIKTDDVSGRTRAYEGLVKQQTTFDAGIPELTHVLKRELIGLGFEVTTGISPTASPAPEKKRDIFSFFEKPQSTDTLTQMLLTLSSDAQIRARSHGEVQKPETLNYRTHKPEAGGLFCARIFGPIADYECVCGKYKRMKHRGVVCEKCGVEVIASKVRRERFGHVDLPVPVLHPWGYGPLAEWLGTDEKTVARIVREHLTYALSPAEDLASGGVYALRDEVRRTRTDDRPLIDHVFYETWPVLPPDLRPIVPLVGGRYATSDLNDLYRRFINRSNRMKRLLELNAPFPILRSEVGHLQGALGALVDNGARGGTVLGFDDSRGEPEKRRLRPIADLTHSHMQMAERGKRVDYSGAAVVVPVPRLSEDCVRLPRSLATELFKPMIYGRLEAAGYVTTIKSAKVMVQKGGDLLEAIAESGMRDHPVLLVTKPGASGPSALGLRVELWDGFAVGLAPSLIDTLQLAAGESVAVHVPLSARAIDEVRGLRVLHSEAGAGSVGGAHAKAHWLAAAIDASPTEFAAVVMGAALHQRVDPLTDLRSRRLLGLRSGPAPEGDARGASSWNDPIPKSAVDEPPPTHPYLERRVDELELSVRTANLLQNMGVVTLRQLVQKSDVDVLKMRDAGRETLKELKEILSELGLSLGMRLDAPPPAPTAPVTPVRTQAPAPSAPAEVESHDFDDLDDID